MASIGIWLTNKKTGQKRDHSSRFDCKVILRYLQCWLRFHHGHHLAPEWMTQWPCCIALPPTKQNYFVFNMHLMAGVSKSLNCDPVLRSVILNIDTNQHQILPFAKTLWWAHPQQILQIHTRDVFLECRMQKALLKKSDDNVISKRYNTWFADIALWLFGQLLIMSICGQWW
jgi:hypothetical protein